MNQLENYGMNQRFLTEAGEYPEFESGRVISQYKDLYKVVTRESELFAEVSGKFRYESNIMSQYPAVGDFVMLDRSTDGNGYGIIHKVLTRKSCFERTAVGVKNQTQVVAANIDTIFICMSLNNDYNLSRLERYLSVAWDSGAVPVVVFTKADLCADLDAVLAEIASVAMGVDSIVTSGLDDRSWMTLRPYLTARSTASFMGSSGVGKSTLVNRLAGEEILSTAGIRGDDKGRHTTTRRELILLPEGGVVIDTPGMRELGADSVDLSKSFADIDLLAEECRFADCSHTGEPGCAVAAAIEGGTLDPRRFENYLKLKKEARYDGLNSKQIETEKINAMFSGVGGMKNAKKFIKEKNKRKY